MTVSIPEALNGALAVCALGDSPNADMLHWWLEIQPGGASIGVSVDAGLQRLTWWSSGPPDAQLPSLRHYLSEGGADEAVVAHFEQSVATLQPATLGSWVELTPDRVGGGWFTPESLASQSALDLAEPSEAKQRLARWVETTGRGLCAGVVRSAFGSQRLTELVLPLSEGTPAARAEAARAAFASLGVPEPDHDVIGVITAEGADALAVHCCLSPAGLTRAGVVVPGADTRLMLALAGRTATFEAAQLADFEDALGAGRSMVLADRADTGLQVEIYYAY